LLLLFTRTNWSVSRGRDRKGYGVKAGMGYRDEAFGLFFFFFWWSLVNSIGGLRLGAWTHGCTTRLRKSRTRGSWMEWL